MHRRTNCCPVTIVEILYLLFDGVGSKDLGDFKISVLLLPPILTLILAYYFYKK